MSTQISSKYLYQIDGSLPSLTSLCLKNRPRDVLSALAEGQRPDKMTLGIARKQLRVSLGADSPSFVLWQQVVFKLENIKRRSLWAKNGSSL